MAFALKPAARAAISGACRQRSRPAAKQLPVESLLTRTIHCARSPLVRALHTPTPANWGCRALAPSRRLRGRRESSDVASQRDEAATSSPKPDDSDNPNRKPLLSEDDLFHSFTDSPIPQMRERAAFLRKHAYCPHPEHRATRMLDDEVRAKRVSEDGSQPPAHVDFECPDCGVPVYCSQEHWASDYEAHLEICDILRQINEDDHDLRSKRYFWEFNLPGVQLEEALVNMSNWDTYFYTRDYVAINEERPMRQITKLLTFPLTIASVLHELSPYNIRLGGRLTTEGLRSFSALRFTLHAPMRGEGDGMKGLRPSALPIRIFVLGARAESSLPRTVWRELAHMFPRAMFHVIFIGPESMLNRDDEFPLPPRTATNPFGAVVEDRTWLTMKISTIVDYYHTVHKTEHFAPFDAYLDCFVLFQPGLGHPSSSHEWKETLPLLLETKAPIIATGYTQHDMERDVKWVEETSKGEFDMLLKPGENIFRSLRWDLNDLDPQDLTCSNWGVWAFRGKRYDATRRDPDVELLR